MSNAKIVGRRLRRYLGTLLAIGFGATWWSLVPPVKAATQPHVVARRPVVDLPPTSYVVVAEPIDVTGAVDDDPPIHISMRLPEARRKLVTHHRPPAPPTIATALVVVAHDPPPIAPPIAEPVADPIPVPDPDPDPFPIRTRSS